jgi:hypothetical protein
VTTATALRHRPGDGSRANGQPSIASIAADGVRLARLLAQGEAMGDLVEVEVPRTVQPYAPVVTADVVEQYLPTAFRS